MLLHSFNSKVHSFLCLNERYPVQYERRRHRTGTSHSHVSNIAPERLAERVWCPKLQSSLPTPKTASSFSSQWVPVLAPIHSLPLRSEYMFTPCSHCEEEWQKSIRYVTIHFQAYCRRGAASLRYKNHAESTVHVLMC